MKRLVLACAVALSMLACTAPAPEATPSANELEAADFATLLARAELIDLTHSFDQKTLYWPTAPSEFELEELAYGETPAGFFYAANSFSTPEHGGTHLDAPIHFAAGQWTADEIPVEKMVGPGVVIDVTAQASTNPDYRLTLADVETWEAEHGTIPEDAIVLLYTGWGERWPDRLAYLGDDTPGDASKLRFPSYGEEAGRFLVEERRVAALGVDTASIDYGPSTDFIVHQIANGANVMGLENVANLGLLPPTGATIFALPMKISGGSGGPARILAVVPR
ncbi:MAG: cyclase family protein [Acidobacteriota bacterium]